MWSLARLGLSLLLLASVVIAENKFLKPWTAGPNKDYSDNPAYPIGATVQFAWSINFEKPNLQLWQDNKPGDALGGPNVIIEEAKLSERTAIEALSSTVYAWRVSYEGLDPKGNNVYYLQLQNGPDVVASHYFNITDAITTSSTSTSATVTLTSATVTLTSATPPAVSTTLPPSPPSPPPTTTTTSQTETPDGGGGLSTGAAAGIAVGTAAGVLILVGALWWRWRSRKTLSGVAVGTLQPLGQGRADIAPCLDNPAKEQVFYEAPADIEPRYHEAPTHAEPSYYEAGGVEIRRH